MVGAQTLVALTGFAPPTPRHGCARGKRSVPAGRQRRDHQCAGTADAAASPVPNLGAYPVLPLVKGMALTIGLTSYNGGVFFGLNADRDAMDDVDVLTACLSEGDGRAAGYDTTDA